MNNSRIRNINLSIVFMFMLFLCDESLTAQETKYSSTEGSVVYQSVKPAKLPLTTPLKNPGIGIEQAGLLEDRAGKTEPVRPSLVGPRNNSLDGIATVRYIRADWNQLEPADNQFHWATLDLNINDAWSNGQQAGFGINCASPVLGGTGNYWQNVPSWFINDTRHVQCTGVNTPEGCTYYRINFTNCSSMGTGADCTDNWGVNHDDPEFIKQQLELIEAIRLRYDTPEWAAKWAYLDMRNWGVWGEWQCDEARISGTSTMWPEPSLANKKAIVDAFLKFIYIPVIANYHDEESWVYACEQGAAKGKTVGWRTDGIEVTAWIINPAISNYPVIRDAWQTGPIYGEAMASSLTNDQLTTLILPRSYTWHMSGWNNKYDRKYTSDVTYKSLVDEFRAKGGYRLAVDEVVVPASVSLNTSFNITVKITNSGVAPLYRKFYHLAVKLVPQSGKGDIIYPLTGELTGVLPGITGTFTINNLSFESEEKYTLFVGIEGDPVFGPPVVNLANTVTQTAGNVNWCQVSTINAGAAAGTGSMDVQNRKPFNFLGTVRIYSLTGSLLKTLSPDYSSVKWMENTSLAPGVYIVRDQKYTELVFLR